MARSLKIVAVLFISLAAISVALYMFLPVNRVKISSELIMLGDLNNDKKWNNADAEMLKDVLNKPFAYDSLTQIKLDLNKNGYIDDEDILFLKMIYKSSNPYRAELDANFQGIFYPRPRELFSYLPKFEYVQPPVFLLYHSIIDETPFTFLHSLITDQNISLYKKQLLGEIYSEAIRFSISYSIRKKKLSDIEKSYVTGKIAQCNRLFQEKKYYQLLLDLISLVEDAETLTTANQTDFIKKILFFRDHLKHLLVSQQFKEFRKGQITYSDIYTKIEEHLKSDLGISLELKSLPSPRDFTDLQNYLDRAEWQVFKSKTTQDSFKQLVLYAQHDRRYLRAVSNTSPKLQDVQLQNHNLPMILLFRKALSITDNNKKAALGLLDEAVRIPLGWVKSIPKNLLPSSIALENFLLPGNMEDGSDKTRHWNVFGGVAIYKSPEESLILALKREIMDMKNSNYSPEAMQEFIRDTIANINGIYYVVSIDPNLLLDKSAKK